MNNPENTDLEKALDIIKTKRIKQVSKGFVKRWIVEGRTSEYLIIGSSFCSCEHFLIRVTKEKEARCYHILATQLSDDIEAITIDNSTIKSFLKPRRV